LKSFTTDAFQEMILLYQRASKSESSQGLERFLGNIFKKIESRAKPDVVKLILEAPLLQRNL